MRQKPSIRSRRTERPADVALPAEVAALKAQGDTEAAARLRDLAASEDRALAKAARRALYTLKQAGIEPPPTSAMPAPPPAAPRPNIARQAFATSVDGSGAQMLIFLQDDPYGGSPWMAQFVVHYGQGLKGVGGRKMPRREVEELLDQMREKEDDLVVEIPVDYARHLLQEAVARNIETRRPLPDRYTEVAPRAGTPERDYPRPLIYDHLDVEAVRRDLSIFHEPERLFEQRFFQGWFLDLDTARPWADRFVESQHTRLHLEPYQLSQRADRVVEQAADELLADQGLPDWRRRLEENALVLHLSGRTDEAKQALCQALTLTKNLPPHTVSFARALTRRTIEAILALQEEKEDDEEDEEPGLIERI
jgi:hypothetical protein